MGKIRLSRIAYGAMRLQEAKHPLETIIDRCLELGITTMDHADIYGGYSCENIFGEVLKVKPHLREQMQIVSKCGICLIGPSRPAHQIKHYNYSKEHIVTSVQNSLKNLRTDHIDLLLFHRPSPMLNPDEVAEAALTLKKSGAVKAFGVSNFNVHQTRMLASRMEIVSNQVEINPLYLQPFVDGTLDQCMELNLTPMAWSPLAGGRLFGSTDIRAVSVVKLLQELAGRYDCTVEQVVYAWLLQHPSQMTIVTGTQQPSRLELAARAEKIQLSLQDWFQVWSASTGQEVP